MRCKILTFMANAIEKSSTIDITLLHGSLKGGHEDCLIFVVQDFLGFDADPLPIARDSWIQVDRFH